MAFPPCPSCGAVYPEGSIGTVHAPNCTALTQQEARPSPLEVRLERIEHALHLIRRELVRHRPWWS